MRFMPSRRTLPILGTLYSLFLGASACSVLVPSAPVDGLSQSTLISSYHNFDAPKITPINSSSYDWWYFDVVSDGSGSGGLKALIIIFYTAGAESFPTLVAAHERGLTSVNLAQISATFANGTTYSAFLNSTDVLFETEIDGTSAVFNDPVRGSASFRGSPDLSEYTVTVDAPEVGVTGTLQLKSIAPAHYPSGPAGPGMSMRVGSDVGWANAIPDADGSAHLEIQGESLDIVGLGYHDKNWGDSPFTDHVDSWYWGHGRLGPYSIVWFDYIGLDGEKRVASYVAMNYTILAAQDSGISVRPYGENSTYPPSTSTGSPTGFVIKAELPEGLLTVIATGDMLLGPPSPYIYYRWAGQLRGGFNNATNLHGSALYEQFAFTEA